MRWQAALASIFGLVAATAAASPASAASPVLVGLDAELGYALSAGDVFLARYAADGAILRTLVGRERRADAR